MKKLKFLVIILAFMSIMSIAAVAAPPQIEAESAVLIDAKTGQVIYQKNMHAKHYPASITKIMTTILAVENLALDDVLTVSQEAVDAVSRSSSHIALTQGEELTVRDAVYAALTASANDACNVLAEAVSGSMDDFALLMTEKAKEFGALNTNFTNSNGLKDENHITSAYDMAMITAHGLKIPEWREMFGARRYDMPPTNKQDEVRNLNKQHVMIFEKMYYYDGIIGGKTGYTTAAKYTLVTAAERDGIELIAVLMRSPDNMGRYEDTKALLDYGFETFKYATIDNDMLNEHTIYTTDSEIEISLDEPVSVLIPTENSIEDIEKEVEMKDGVPYLTLKLPGSDEELASCALSYETVPTVAPVVPKKGIGFFGVLLIIVGSIIGLLALFVLFIYVRKEIYLWHRRRMRRNSRRRRR